MRYRWFVLLLALLLPLPVAAQDEIRLHWEQYDTIVDIQSDGSLRVREQQTLVVDQGTLRRMTRVFNTGDKGRVRDIQVAEDGQPYRRGADTPGTYTGSDNGEEAQIRLWFADPSATRHLITISYTVEAALEVRGDQAVLDWAFFWGDPGAPRIDSGSVTLRFPQQVNASELRLNASGPPVRVVSEANPVVWELTEPIQGAELAVQATFPRAILASNAIFRSTEGRAGPRANVPADPAGNPNSAPVPGAAPAAGFNLVFCVFVLLFLFIAFSIIRASARARGARGYPPAPGPGPDYDPDPLGGPGPRSRRRRRRHGGWGGWGGGFFPPIIITPPSPPRDQGGPFTSPHEGSPFGESGGSSSGWGESGGSSSSWGDMGGGGSSWGGGGGGGSGGGSDRGGSGGGSFG